MAADRASMSGMGEADLHYLVAEASSPDRLEAVAETLFVRKSSVSADESLDLETALATHADASAFSVAEWREALECLAVHLHRERRTTTLDSALGYLGCAADYGASQGRMASLEAVVDDFLKQYGFEGKDDI